MLLPLLVKPLRTHHLLRLMLLAQQPMPLAPLLMPVPLLPTLLLLLLHLRKVPLLLQKRPSRNLCPPGDAMSPGVSAWSLRWQAMPESRYRLPAQIL